MSAGGGIVVLVVGGGLERARRFLDALQLLSHSPNLGDARSIVTHPASTTHSKLGEDERRALGIVPGLVRISVGLEHVDDVIADVAQALDRSAGPSAVRRAEGAGEAAFAGGLHGASVRA
jgi:O-succinylhomoserine sulfhydrylase